MGCPSCARAAAEIKPRIPALANTNLITRIFSSSRGGIKVVLKGNVPRCRKVIQNHSGVKCKVRGFVAGRWRCDCFRLPNCPILVVVVLNKETSDEMASFGFLYDRCGPGWNSECRIAGR